MSCEKLIIPPAYHSELDTLQTELQSIKFDKDTLSKSSRTRWGFA
jgi:hypothetical protein